MAIIRVYRSIENDVWRLTFVNDPIALSETDKALMRKFGEPEIAAGGTFMASTENEYTLPEKYIKIRSDFPFVQEFDATATPFDTNTLTKVQNYESTLVELIGNALVDLRETPDTFTGEGAYTL